MSQPNGGGPGLFRPPQSETRQAGIPTDWKLVILQGLGLGVAGNVVVLAIALVMFGRRLVIDWREFLPWAAVAWRWPVMLMVLWWIFPAVVVGWRFFVEIVDPSYPTPRTSIPPEDQPLGPIMPWHRDRWADEEKMMAPVAERVIRVEVQNGEQQRIVFLPDVPGIDQFARAIVNGQPFNEATAIRFKLSGQWNEIRKQALDRGLVTWRDPDEHRQGMKVEKTGMAVLAAIGGVRSPFMRSVVTAIPSKPNGRGG